MNKVLLVRYYCADLREKKIIGIASCETKAREMIERYFGPYDVVESFGKGSFDWSAIISDLDNDQYEVYFEQYHIDQL